MKKLRLESFSDFPRSHIFPFIGNTKKSALLRFGSVPWEHFLIFPQIWTFFILNFFIHKVELIISTLLLSMWGSKEKLYMKSIWKSLNLLLLYIVVMIITLVIITVISGNLYTSSLIKTIASGSLNLDFFLLKSKILHMDQRQPRSVLTLMP